MLCDSQSERGSLSDLSLDDESHPIIDRVISNTTQNFKVFTLLEINITPILTGKKWLAKISERSEQKANCFLSLLNCLLYAHYEVTNITDKELVIAVSNDNASMIFLNLNSLN